MNIAYELFKGERWVGGGVNDSARIRTYAKHLGSQGTIDRAYFTTAAGSNSIPVVPFEFYRDGKSIIRGTVVKDYKEGFFLWCTEMFGVNRATFKTRRKRETIDLRQPVTVGV